MSRNLIDRDELLEKAKQEQRFYKDEYDAMESGYLDEERAIVKEAYSTMTDCVSLIENAPTIDAVEVIHGHWTNISISVSGHSSAECSVCGCVVHDSFSNVINYCPNCGAKMDREVKNDE